MQNKPQHGDLRPRGDPWPLGGVFRLAASVACVLFIVFFAPLGRAEIPAGPEARTEEDFLQKKTDWLLRHTIGAYEKGLYRDPKWDETAVRFLRDSCMVTPGEPHTPDVVEAMVKTGKALLDAGCCDPLVLRWYGVWLSHQGNQEEADAFYRKALEKLGRGAYPNVYTFYTVLNLVPRGFILESEEDVPVEESEGLRALAQAIRASEFEKDEWDIAYRLVEVTCAKRFSKFRYKEMVRLLEDWENKDPWLWNMFNGQAEIRAAWDARGGEWGYKVTQEGWKGFAEHLEKAREALLEAWKLRPGQPEASASMITVTMGGHGGSGETVRLWFDRAVGVQMDYEPAYDNLLWAFRPRWGGSWEAMHQLGVECLNTGRFDTLVPLFYLKAVRDVASELGPAKGRAIFRNQDVQSNLTRLFDGMLKEQQADDTFRKRLLAQQAMVEIWRGNYEKGREFLDQAGPETDLDDGFHGYLISWNGMDRSQVETEVRAFTGPQKTKLAEAESLQFAGRPDDAIRLFTEAMEASKEDDKVRRYLLDRIAMLQLGDYSESLDEQITEIAGFSAIHHAVYYGNLEVVRFLIKNEGDWNVASKGSRTPFYIAVHQKQPKIAWLLLKQGADIQTGTKRGWTPLHTAIRLGREDIAWELLARGVDIHGKNQYGQTPLHIALRNNNPGIARKLIEMGAEVDGGDWEGWTPLHFAVHYQPEVAPFLLDKGAHADTVTDKNWTPLHTAIRLGHRELTARILKQNVPLDIKNEFGWAPIHLAIFYDQPEFALQLIEKGADVNLPGYAGITPIQYAITKNCREVFLRLIEKGADLNAAADSKERPITRAVGGKQAEFTKVLVARGADLNVRDGKGWTPLLIALSTEQPEIAQLLIEKGADVNAPYTDGFAPLHRAAEKGYVPIVKLLLRKGAKPDCVSSENTTPLDLAKKQNRTKVIRILENYIRNPRSLDRGIGGILGAALAIAAVAAFLAFVWLQHKKGRSTPV